MTTKAKLINYALAQGWDDDTVAELEQALDEGLEQALGVLGEWHCPAVVYCEMVTLLLEWYQASGNTAGGL